MFEKKVDEARNFLWHMAHDTLYDHIRNKPDMITKDFEMAGIVETINKELEPEDPFEDLV